MSLDKIKAKYKPCPHCKKYEFLGLDGGGRVLCLCGENYFPKMKEKTDEMAEV